MAHPDRRQSWLAAGVFMGKLLDVSGLFQPCSVTNVLSCFGSTVASISSSSTTLQLTCSCQMALKASGLCWPVALATFGVVLSTWLAMAVVVTVTIVQLQIYVCVRVDTCENERVHANKRIHRHKQTSVYSTQRQTTTGEIHGGELRRRWGRC